MFLPNVVGSDWKDLQVIQYIPLILPALWFGTRAFIGIATQTIVYRENFTCFYNFQSLKPDKKPFKIEKIDDLHKTPVMHGFEYEKGQGERDRDELSLQFWWLAVVLDGELSSQELSLGL